MESTSTGSSRAPTNFTLLAKEFRSQLDAQGTVDRRHYLFSIAVGIDPGEIDLPSVAPSADFFNIMTYNFHGASMKRGDVTNFENPLESAPGDPTPGLNVDAVIKKFLATGVSPSKFVLGITSYAHSYAGVGSASNGLYQPYSGAGPSTFTTPGILTFKDVRLNYIPKCQPHVIGDWHSSWLYCPGPKVFISYESVEEIREKAVFANKESLGGLMLWELGADDNATLLSEANLVLNGGCAVGAQWDACGSSVCNDGTCQAGIVTNCTSPSHPVCTSGCAGHGGVNTSLGCVRTP